MAIHAIAVETFHSPLKWWTDQETDIGDGGRRVTEWLSKSAVCVYSKSI